MFFNSKDCSWTDMEVFISGKRIAKITGIKYKKSQAKEALYAAGDEPHSIQRGEKSYTGELKVLKSALDQMNAAAILAGYDDIMDVEDLQIVVSYKASVNRALTTDTLIGVDITEYEQGWETKAKEMEVTLPFVFLRLKK